MHWTREFVCLKWLYFNMTAGIILQWVHYPYNIREGARGQ